MVTTKSIDASLLNQVAQLAVQAGELIMGVYQREGDIVAHAKSDDSPLTEADLLAHHCLSDNLSALLPEVPVLSEEGGLPSYEVRKHWQSYWLIDPLDGTKEFVSRNGEFTVNIALIIDGKPALGVVYAPVLKKLYKAINSGLSSDGAFCVDLGEDESTSALSIGRAIVAQKIQDRIENQSAIRVLVSRHHGKENLQALCQEIESKYGEVKKLAIGSSLKLCLVAEGEADLYPRLGPTSEWDTAAAQAIVEAAGGSVLNGRLQPLRYNQKESILNPNFYAVSVGVDVSSRLEGKWLSMLSEFDLKQA